MTEEDTFSIEVRICKRRGFDCVTKGYLGILPILTVLLCVISCTTGRPPVTQDQEIEIRGTLRLTLTEMHLVSGGVSYLIQEDSDTRYDCPKPSGKIAYVTIGQAPHVDAYLPIGKNYIYAVKGWIDNTAPERKIIHASFITWTRK